MGVDQEGGRRDGIERPAQVPDVELRGVALYEADHFPTQGRRRVHGPGAIPSADRSTPS